MFKIKNHNKYFLSLVFTSIIVLLFGVTEHGVFAQIAVAANSPKVFLNDTFNTDLQGWQHYGKPGYTINLDTSTGVPSPSANISGDDVPDGTCQAHGMYKIVDISKYSSGPLTLAFNWRASSTSGTHTTVAEVQVDDAITGNQLFVHRLVTSAAYDTGWQFYSTDISSYVKGVNTIQTDLYLYDCWDTDWSQNNWYDNIQLFKGTYPPSSPSGLTSTALSSSEIYLNWAAGTNGGTPTGYKIERSIDNGNTWSTAISNTGTNATSYTDSGLSPSTTYTYRVSAINQAGKSPPSNTASATTLSSNVFLNDNFNTDLQGWQHYGKPGYTINLDTSTGMPSASANISGGDAYDGTCQTHGMSKVVDITQYLTGPLTLAFNWRASSTSGIDTTQAEVRVDDAITGNQLFVHRLVNSGTYDTGWQYYSVDISNDVLLSKKIQVDLYLVDCWVTDWNQNNWYDNVQLFAGSSPLQAKSMVPTETSSPPVYRDMNTTSTNSTAS